MRQTLADGPVPEVTSACGNQLATITVLPHIDEGHPRELWGTARLGVGPVVVALSSTSTTAVSDVATVVLARPR